MLGWGAEGAGRRHELLRRQCGGPHTPVHPCRPPLTRPPPSGQYGHAPPPTLSFGGPPFTALLPAAAKQPAWRLPLVGPGPHPMAAPHFLKPDALSKVQGSAWLLGAQRPHQASPATLPSPTSPPGSASPGGTLTLPHASVSRATRLSWSPRLMPARGPPQPTAPSFSPWGVLIRQHRTHKCQCSRFSMGM